MTLKMAVFAPMPSASVSKMTAVKPGLLRSPRAPSRMPCATEERRAAVPFQTASPVTDSQKPSRPREAYSSR